PRIFGTLTDILPESSADARHITVRQGQPPPPVRSGRGYPPAGPPSAAGKAAERAAKKRESCRKANAAEKGLTLTQRQAVASGAEGGDMSYSVGEVARLTGVTVRTLHHYDEIGLLSPSGRTAAGYRQYSEADLERLQQILTYRELGFPLEEIAEIVADPRADALTHLRRQHALLVGRMERLRKMIDAVEFMMEAQQMGIQLTPQERFEVFGDFDPDQYAEEAEQRWGGS